MLKLDELYTTHPHLVNNPAHAARIVHGNLPGLQDRINALPDAETRELFADLLSLIAWLAGASASNQRALHASIPDGR